jgi:hypothetical protein
VGVAAGLLATGEQAERVAARMMRKIGIQV